MDIVVSDDDESLFISMEKLPKTKNQLRNWYSTFVKKGWKIISTAYCEKSEITEELHEKLGMPIGDYLFLGIEDFLTKLEKMHKSLGKVKKRFDCYMTLSKGFFPE